MYFPWNISSMLLCVYRRRGGFFYFYDHVNTFDCCLVTTRIAPHSADRGPVKCHWNKQINNSSAILEPIDKQCWTPSTILICSCCEFERGSSRSTYILFEKIARTGQWRIFAFLKVSPKLDNDQCWKRKENLTVPSSYSGPVQTPLHSCAKPNWWNKHGKRAAPKSIRYGSFSLVRQKR